MKVRKSILNSIKTSNNSTYRKTGRQTGTDTDRKIVKNRDASLHNIDLTSSILTQKMFSYDEYIRHSQIIYTSHAVLVIKTLKSK